MDSYSDSAKYTETDISSQTSGKEFSQFNANAYGKVILPGGTTYNNVLRLTMITKDLTYSTLDSSYIWLSPNLHEIVLFISYSYDKNGKIDCTFGQCLTPNASGINYAHQGNTDLTVFPNPVNTNVSIQYELEKTSHVMLSIINPLGQQVRNLVNERQTKGKYNQAISIIDLPKGMYFIKLNSDGKEQIKKLIIE